MRRACTCIVCAGSSEPREMDQCHGYWAEDVPCLDCALAGELLCQVHMRPQSDAIMSLQRLAAKDARMNREHP